MTIAFVQKSAQLFGDGVSTISPSLSSVAAGNLVVCTVANSKNTNVGSSIPTPSGWSLGIAPTGPDRADTYPPVVAIFYKVSTGGTESPSVSVAGDGSAYCEATLSEFSSSTGWPANPVDVTASHSDNQSPGVTTGVTGTTGTTAQAVALAIAMGGQSGATISGLPSTGYTSIDNSPTANVHCGYVSEYKILSATGAQGTNWAQTPAESWAGAIVVFKPNASGSDTPVSPGAATLTLTGPAPTIARTANQSVSPAQAALSLTGPAPTIARTANQGVSPAQATLTLAGPAPTITQAANASVSPGAAVLTLQGLAPTLAQTANQAVSPGAAALVLAGYAPTIANSGAITPTGLPGIDYEGTPAPRRVRFASIKPMLQAAMERRLPAAPEPDEPEQAATAVSAGLVALQGEELTPRVVERLAKQWKAALPMPRNVTREDAQLMYLQAVFEAQQAAQRAREQAAQRMRQRDEEEALLAALTLLL